MGHLVTISHCYLFMILFLRSFGTYLNFSQTNRKSKLISLGVNVIETGI